MSHIAFEIERLHKALEPYDASLVAVSKFHPVPQLMKAYDAGQRIFGESRAQEFLTKVPEMPEDVKWHFIGHLQTNKVKQIIGKTYLIESVDSERLFELIDRESEKMGVVTNILLQAHVAAEEAKFGFYPEELLSFLKTNRYQQLKNVRICGLMGMATNTDDEVRIRRDFQALHSLFEEIRNDETFDLPDFRYLSMGMSGDWPLAVENGANIVRIGSAIFGERI